MAKGKRTEHDQDGLATMDGEPLAVVGVGVAARSLASLERMFSHLPDDAGIAYIVALKSEPGLDAAAVVGTLTRHSGLPTALAVDGARIEPDHIYVGSNHSKVVLRDGHLGVSKTSAAPEKRGTIDTLLVSLAEHVTDRAVAVVLAGLESDGVLGVATLKETGGLTIVEQDDESPLDPNPVTPVGMADLVVRAEQIADEILSYARRLAEPMVGGEGAEDPTGEYLASIATILRNKTGHDFHGYKANTFLRRVQRRMNVVQAADIDAYVRRLRDEPAEADHLFQDMLIGVTQFFRDPVEFARIEQEVIPALFKDSTASKSVRVWVLGCATGEEAYTLSILLREHAATLPVVPHIQVFATDIDGRALAQARSGRYPASIADDISPERLARWFAREGDTYVVHKDLREMCLFSAHNFIKDAPFSRIDLISCRNLLIYLNSDLQDRIMPVFHFALRPGGYLFLGPSENITRHTKLFTSVDRRHRIFKRVDTAARVVPDFPLGARPAGAGDLGSRRPRAQGSASAIGKRAQRIAERYAPAYIVADADYEVLHFSGHTGPFVDPSPGSASLNLMNLVHRDMRMDMRAALHKADADGVAVKIERLKLGQGAQARFITLIVEPVLGDDEPASYVVIFQEAGAGIAAERDAVTGAHSEMRDAHVARLEGELSINRERLQSTVEELESTNEELKSSNEEYQSINEELQSANEELETAKEELQSVNEELHTVNGELSHRVNDLARSNSDLKNLLESTQIATVFLDNDLRLRSFTPTVTDLFHVVDTDVGRLIGHIAARIAYPELEEDARKVLRNLTAVEREIDRPDNRTRFLVRVLPYRSIDNFIAGVVLTFLDISATARAEQALRESEGRYRLIVEGATDYAIMAMDMEGRVTGWNPGARNIFGWEEGEMIGRTADIIFTPEDRDAKVPRREQSTALAQGKAQDQRWHIRKDGSRLWASGLMTVLGDQAPAGFLKILRDQTAERENEERQKLLLAELQHRVRNILAVVRSLASRTIDASTDLDDFASHFDGRLDTLARTQNVLTRTTTATVDLEELVRDELLALALLDDRQIKVRGPVIRLRPRAAEVMALALHELATNAVKYGALSTPAGRLTVEWRVFNTKGGPRLSLDWRESGVKVLNAMPRRVGFGRDLIERGLPYELGAATSLEFAPGGVRAAIEVPVSDEIAVSEGPDGVSDTDERADVGG